MLKMSKTILCLAVLALAIFSGSFSAHAQNVSQDSIKILQAQINALQKQLEDVKAAQTETAKAVRAAPAATAEAAEPTGRGEFKVGHVKVKVGGFMEAAGLYRSKNETADIGSNFNTGLPFRITGAANAQNPNAYQSEFRGTARQSRVTALAEAKVNPSTLVSAYVESDFLGAAPTANSNESNSYNPRVRVVYGTVDMADCGLHILAGQEWSLLTTDRVGIIPRSENIPLTIDAQYVPGFNWTRNPQLRVVEDFFDKRVWLGVSVESPQAVLSGIGTPPAFINGFNAGGSLFSSTNNYTSDFAPDIIAKAAFDPGWGHYEVFGITRFFHDYVLAHGAPVGAHLGNNDATSFAGGAAAIVPICPEKLEFQANFMGGQGIGRYGSCQLPDFAFKANGDLSMLTGYTGLVGLVGHPTPTWDAYLYGGYEGVLRADNTTTVANAPSIGYGDFNLITGQEQTSNVWQFTAGFWKRIYQGPFGKVQVGLSDSVTRRTAFGNDAGVTQRATENIIMTSFRFYPM